MKILIDNLHIPYSYDLVGAISGSGELYHCTWAHDVPGANRSQVFRPIPNGLNVIPREDGLLHEWDLFITDTADRWLLCNGVKAKRKIAILHLERHEPPSEEMERFLAQFDAIVTPAENKTGTWMDYTYRFPFVTIPLAVDGDDYPLKEDWNSPTIGTAMNSISKRVGCLENWLELTRGHGDKLVIGGNNDPMVLRSPVTDVLDWDSYRASLRSLGVFVYIVEGNETGMAPREAMASGVPVVTGVMPELYWFAYPGYDICMSRASCSRSIPELRNWIYALVTMPDLRERIGRNGRKAILRAYPMERFRRQWRELVRTVSRRHANRDR